MALHERRKRMTMYIRLDTTPTLSGHTDTDRWNGQDRNGGMVEQYRAVHAYSRVAVGLVNEAAC